MILPDIILSHNNLVMYKTQLKLENSQLTTKLKQAEQRLEILYAQLLELRSTKSNSVPENEVPKKRTLAEKIKEWFGR